MFGKKIQKIDSPVKISWLQNVWCQSYNDKLVTFFHQNDMVAINADGQELFPKYTKSSSTSLNHITAPFASVVPLTIPYSYIFSHIVQYFRSTLVYTINIQCNMGTIDSIILHFVGHAFPIKAEDWTFISEKKLTPNQSL